MAAQQDYIPEALRQKVRQQMEETFSRFSNPFLKSAEEIEKSVFEAAKSSKEKYLPVIQNIFKRAKLAAAAKQAQAQRAQQQQQNQMGGMGPTGMSQGGLVMGQSTMASSGMGQGNLVQASMASSGGISAQSGMSNQGMMRPPMQPSQPMSGPIQGMQRQFGNAPMPRGGPPSDSPGSMNMQSPLSSGGLTGYSPDNRMPHPSPGTQFYSHRPPVVGRPTQPQPSQQPQLKMPDNTYANTPHGSVGSTYIPSLSPAHPSNSPQISAMSPALRTPGSVSVAHSPASAAVPSPSNPVINEEQLYMEKLKQLQKYVDPLSRMINKEKNSKDLSKMKSLRDILMDSTKRLPMATLLKCEKVLQNWKDVKPVPTPPPPRPDQHMCQPLLDAVATAIKSPMLNHTLKRTFGPALQVLNGDYYVPESSCTKRIRIRAPSNESDTEPGIKVPDLVQGEIARLGSKFKVTVDQSQSSNCGTLHLICRLDDTSLPTVPPIRLLVPTTYPKEGPEWRSWSQDDTSDTEDAELESEAPQTESEGMKKPEFLSKLKPNMKTQIDHAMIHNETISGILTAWERSVKQTMACERKG